jgi:hypothetical protein
MNLYKLNKKLIKLYHNTPIIELNKLLQIMNTIALLKVPPNYVPLFNYGSNGIIQLNSRLGQNNVYQYVFKAQLDNYKRVFFAKSINWGGGTAAVIPHNGSYVRGSIVYVNRDRLSDLDSAEAAPFKYQRQQISVKIVPNNELVNCYVYVHNTSYTNTHNFPSELYKDSIWLHLKNAGWELDGLEIQILGRSEIKIFKYDQPIIKIKCPSHDTDLKYERFLIPSEHCLMIKRNDIEIDVNPPQNLQRYYSKPYRKILVGNILKQRIINNNDTNTNKSRFGFLNNKNEYYGENYNEIRLSRGASIYIHKIYDGTY